MLIRYGEFLLAAGLLLPAATLAQSSTVYNGQTYTTVSQAAPSYGNDDKESGNDKAQDHRCGPPPDRDRRGPPPDNSQMGNRPPPPPMDDQAHRPPPPDGCRPPPPPENASGTFDRDNQYPN